MHAISQADLCPEKLCCSNAQKSTVLQNSKGRIFAKAWEQCTSKVYNPLSENVNWDGNNADQNRSSKLNNNINNNSIGKGI